MSGGITSYPRTNGGGGSPLTTIRQLMARLNSPSKSVNARYARQLIAALDAFARGQTTQGTHAAIIPVAIEVRDALFVARSHGNLATEHHSRAMEICAAAFRVTTPFANTGFVARANAAFNGANTAATATQLRGFKEEIGLVAWLYEASALLGVDLSAGAAGNAAVLHANWAAHYVDPPYNTQLDYLETGASYNVNIVISIDIPGGKGPLVMAGEAKGGSSTYGTVKGPAYLFKKLKIKSPVSQQSLMYARTRAAYMQRQTGTKPHQKARKQAGDMIESAAAEKRLAFVAARGDITATAIPTIKMDYFKCQ
ncbi:hypothetical protein [Burkholderia plantarii]|nr:hypothetical protein [Burkholderia plantarii]